MTFVQMPLSPFLFAAWLIVSGFHCFVFQRLNIHAVNHDHGSYITKGVRLSGTHSVLCVDHELDLTVQAGIKSASFARVFNKAAHIVSLLGIAKMCIANFVMSRYFVLPSSSLPP